MSRSITKISKFLSYILRHNPEKIGLRLYKGGWASIDELIDKAGREGYELDRRKLDKVVHESQKKRFTISDDGVFIRANYGHSIEIDLELEPAPPPEKLYHGTVRRNLSAIQDEGLNKGGRQYVHLSEEKSSARQVGSRHGTPVILTIASGKMHRDDYTFFQTDSGIWLTEQVPPGYIAFPR